MSRVNALYRAFMKDKKERERELGPTLAEKFEAMMELRRDPRHRLLVEDGWKRLIEIFVSWLELDQSNPRDRELVGLMQVRAAAIYEELFRPEAIVKEYKDEIERRRHAGGERDKD